MAFTRSNYYSCAYVGFVNNPPGPTNIDGVAIGGINTRGLCFDANGLEAEYVNPDLSAGAPKSGLGYWEVILRKCATVEEVIQWYNEHNMGGWWYNQVHWADASGDAVVISAVNGGIAYTRKTTNYLVSTNFNLANPDNGWYPCSRYDTVVSNLENIAQEDKLTLDLVRDILDEVHLGQTSSYIGTVYSNVFDLKSQEIYLYIHANYDEVVRFNLEDELAKGHHEYLMTDLPIETTKTSTVIGFIGLSDLIALITACYWSTKLFRTYRRRE